jgi:signal transduction histidine kinase
MRAPLSVEGVFLVRDLVSPRAWLATIHHLAGFLIGVPACIVIVAGFIFGVGFLWLALASLPVLGITLRLAGWLARGERARFALLLGARIPAWPAEGRAGYRWGVIPRLRTLRDRATWGEVGYALLRPVFSAVALAFVLQAWAYGLAMVTLPVYDSALPAGSAVIGGTAIRGAVPLLVSVAGGIVLLAAAPQLARGFAAADVGLTRGLLGPPSDLAARVTELQVSRERVVDAAEAERRRIERDLHDGAQQRLVALAMELGRAKAKFAEDVDAAQLLVDQAHAQAKEALTELRNLVRGVHPPVLTDRGLDAALSGLVALCPVPVTLRIEVPVRPKASVEAVAYFVVAEALTNVTKHSRASQATVTVEGRGYPGTLTVMISDDGIGGADPAGAGLSGLADRVSGVDGRFSVESPSGGPTIIAAELPCG